MYNFPGEFFQSEQRAFIFSVFLFLYLASKPSILYCEQSNRERTRERAAKLFPAHSRVISRDFPKWRACSQAIACKCLKKNGKGEIKALENEVGTRGRTERNLRPLPLLPRSYFMFPCAIWYPTWQCCITLEPSTLCSNSLFFMRSFLARSQNCKQPENPAVLWCPFQSHLSVKWNISFEQYTR